MSDAEQRSRSQHGEPIRKRGIYLMADTPLTAHPLVVEDGSGDRNLLREFITEELSTGALIDLRCELADEIDRRYEAEGGELP